MLFLPVMQEASASIEWTTWKLCSISWLQLFSFLHLILTVTLWGRYYYYPSVSLNLKFSEIKYREAKNFRHKGTQLERSGVVLWTRLSEFKCSVLPIAVCLGLILGRLPGKSWRKGCSSPKQPGSQARGNLLGRSLPAALRCQPKALLMQPPQENRSLWEPGTQMLCQSCSSGLAGVRMQGDPPCLSGEVIAGSRMLT